MQMIKVKAFSFYDMQTQEVVKNHALINPEFITTITLGKQRIDPVKFTDIYYIHFSNSDVIEVLPEDMEPVWLAVGAELN